MSNHVKQLNLIIRKYDNLISSTMNEGNAIRLRLKRMMKLRSDLFKAGQIIVDLISNISTFRTKLEEELLVTKRSIILLSAIRKKAVHEYFEKHLKGVALSSRLLHHASSADYDIVGKTFEPESRKPPPQEMRLFAEEMPRWKIREVYTTGRKKNLNTTHNRLVNNMFLKNAEKKYHSEFHKYMRQIRLCKKNKRRDTIIPDVDSSINTKKSRKNKE